jgi:hypothetical protein
MAVDCWRRHYSGRKLTMLGCRCTCQVFETDKRTGEGRKSQWLWAERIDNRHPSIDLRYCSRSDDYIARPIIPPNARPVCHTRPLDRVTQRIAYFWLRWGRSIGVKLCPRLAA